MFISRLIFVTFIVLNALIQCTFAKDEGEAIVDHEKKLRAFLKQKLPNDTQSRPSQLLTNVTNVAVYPIITHVMSLDERTETLSVNGIMVLAWWEYRVRWDPVDYGDITYTQLSVNDVWKPQLHLYNSANFANSHLVFGDTRITVFSYGTLRWAPTFTSQTVCSVDLRWFPFDEQSCFLEFGSWIDMRREINYTLTIYMSETLLPHFADVHNEWELLKTYTETFHFGPDVYTVEKSVRCHVELRRRATYYHYLLILPSVIGIILCLVIFWTPSSFKFSLGAINIFLLTILTCHLYYVVPRSGDSVPTIITICGNTLALAGVSLLFSVITVNLSQRTDDALIPEVIRQYLAGWLGIILCLRSMKDTGVPDTRTKEMMSQGETAKSNDSGKKINGWMQVATAIDRILFIVYVFTFFIVLLTAFT